MIGKTVSARPGFPAFGILNALIAVGLIGAALIWHEANLGLTSLLFVALALPSWLSRISSWSMEFQEYGLLVHTGGQVIPYENLQALTPAKGFTSRRLLSEATGAFHVFHRDGILSVPARLDRPTHEVYGFFLDLMGASGSREVPAELRSYLEKQTATFGEGRVWSFVERAHTQRPGTRTGARWYALTFFLCGIAWIVAGSQSNLLAGWIGGGSFLLFVSFIFFLVSFLSPTAGMKKSRKGSRAGLVISPLGLALVHGDISGELRWDELRGLTLGVTSSWTRGGFGSPPFTLQLRVEGAEILIWDIYDRPLELIYAQMNSYWRGGK